MKAIVFGLILAFAVCSKQTYPNYIAFDINEKAITEGIEGAIIGLEKSGSAHKCLAIKADITKIALELAHKADNEGLDEKILAGTATASDLAPYIDSAYAFTKKHDGACNFFSAIKTVSKWTSSITVAALVSKLTLNTGKLTNWGNQIADAAKAENFKEAGRVGGEAASWVLNYNVNEEAEEFVLA